MKDKVLEKPQHIETLNVTLKDVETDAQTEMQFVEVHVASKSSHWD